MIFLFLAEIAVFVLPSYTLQEQILRETHMGVADNVAAMSIAAHLGREKMVYHIRERYWFPGITVRIEAFIRCCFRCQQTHPTKINKTGRPLTHVPTPNQPFRKWGIDMIGPLPPCDGYKYVVTAIDYHTKFVELRATKNKDAITIADFLWEDVICRHGVPRQIITDNGSEFANSLYAAVAEKTGIKHIKTSPYHPQSNGLVERHNQTLERKILTCTHDHRTDWVGALPGLRMATNSSRQSSTGMSPFKMCHGIEAVMPEEANLQGEAEEEGITEEREAPTFDYAFHNFQSAREKAIEKGYTKEQTERRAEKLSERVREQSQWLEEEQPELLKASQKDLQETLHKIREKGMENDLKAKAHQAKLHNMKYKHRPFQVGDEVLRRDVKNDQRKQKLYTRFHGPYIINSITPMGNCYLARYVKDPAGEDRIEFSDQAYPPGQLKEFLRPLEPFLKTGTFYDDNYLADLDERMEKDLRRKEGPYPEDVSDDEESGIVQKQQPSQQAPCSPQTTKTVGPNCTSTPNQKETITNPQEFQDHLPSDDDSGIHSQPSSSQPVTSQPCSPKTPKKTVRQSKKVLPKVALTNPKKFPEDYRPTSPMQMKIWQLSLEQQEQQAEIRSFPRYENGSPVAKHPSVNQLTRTPKQKIPLNVQDTRPTPPPAKKRLRLEKGDVGVKQLKELQKRSAAPSPLNILLSKSLASNGDKENNSEVIDVDRPSFLTPSKRLPDDGPQFLYKPLTIQQRRQIAASQGVTISEKLPSLPRGPPAKLHNNQPPKVQGNSAGGACFFKSVAFSISNDESWHRTLRANVCAHIIHNWTKLEFNKVAELREDGTAYDHGFEYVDGQEMLRTETWATQCEVYATANLLGVDIICYSSDGFWSRFPASRFSECPTERSIYIMNIKNIHFVAVVGPRA